MILVEKACRTVFDLGDPQVPGKDKPGGFGSRAGLAHLKMAAHIKGGGPAKHTFYGATAAAVIGQLHGLGNRAQADLSDPARMSCCRWHHRQSCVCCRQR